MLYRMPETGIEKRYVNPWINILLVRYSLNCRYKYPRTITFRENYLIVPSSLAHACLWRHSRKWSSYSNRAAYACCPVKGWSFDTFGPIVSLRNVEKNTTRWSNRCVDCYTGSKLELYCIIVLCLSLSKKEWWRIVEHLSLINWTRKKRRLYPVMGVY